MLFSSRNYAIGMAHHQISGGRRTLLLLGGAYAMVVAVLLALVLYNVPASHVAGAMLAISTFLLVIEAFVLLVFGAVRVAGCIRTDIATNMLESHRQMPVSAWRAVLGYMLGSTTHVLAITALGILAILITEQIGGIPLDNLFISQMVLAAFALFMWSFSAMATLMFRQAMPLMVAGFIFGSISSMFLRSYGILPAVSLLISPFLGETIFNLSSGAVSVRNAYPIALAAQLAFGALFFAGACRRYRGTYLTTFNVPMGLALVAVWGALSAVSIRIWPEVIAPFRRGFDQPEPVEQIVAALPVAALLMIVPIQALSAWESRHRVKAWVKALVLAGAVAVGCLSLLGQLPSQWLLDLTLLVMAANAATMYQGLRLLRGMTAMTQVIMMVVLLFVIWILPILIEAARWIYLENHAMGPQHDYSMISTLSPLGLLITMWTGDIDRPAPWVGLAVQWAAPAALLALAQRRARLSMPKISGGGDAMQAPAI